MKIHTRIFDQGLPSTEGGMHAYLYSDLARSMSIGGNTNDKNVEFGGSRCFSRMKMKAKPLLTQSLA